MKNKRLLVLIIALPKTKLLLQLIVQRTTEAKALHSSLGLIIKHCRTLFQLSISHQGYQNQKQ